MSYSFQMIAGSSLFFFKNSYEIFCVFLPHNFDFKLTSDAKIQPAITGREDSCFWLCSPWSRVGHALRPILCCDWSKFDRWIPQTAQTLEAVITTFKILSCTNSKKFFLLLAELKILKRLPNGSRGEETVNNKTQTQTQGKSFYFYFYELWNLGRILFIFVHPLINSKSNELPQSLGCLPVSSCGKFMQYLESCLLCQLKLT